MRIIKMSVEDYLKALGCTEEIIGNVIGTEVYDSETLRTYLNEFGKEYLWDYPEWEVFFLLKCEEENNEYRECHKEETYVHLFDRLWEVEV